LPSIQRRSDRGVPLYRDGEETDVFVLSGAEDLVPALKEFPGGWEPDRREIVEGEDTFVVHRYRPRIEGLFARVERWVRRSDGDVHWRTLSAENVSTIYGKTPQGRIVDPADPSRVFSWLMQESRDDKGNVLAVDYKTEDAVHVDPFSACERNRLRTGSFAQKYPKRIRYGNQAPFAAGPWLFEVVFDYGDHHPTAPTPAEDRPWPVRPDPFSTHRAGFEVRTYRLCRRVLMFHRFSELGPEPCLVRSTDLAYQEDPVLTKLVAVTLTGYIRRPDGTYQTKSLPPATFGYTEPQLSTEVKTLAGDSDENLPRGLGGAYEWVDLEGEGLAGILTDQGGAWAYKENLGDGTLGPMRRLETRPGAASLSGGSTQLMDLAGDGRLDVVSLEAEWAGFYERNPEGYWDRFRPFVSTPRIDWRDPNLRFIDLDGDGKSDALITEDEVLRWYPLWGEDGFGPARTVRKAKDEESGPTLVFADREHSVFLADMDGDGLTDLVRIRNGEVSYWPNQGHGRFGARVSMVRPPVLGSPEDYAAIYGPSRIRLADLDGTGMADLLYVNSDGSITLWVNQAGNGWSEPRRLPVFPVVDRLSDVRAVDLLGNGTACLVWSSPAPRDAGRSLRYVDLMGGVKPHLLTEFKNNLGKEVRLHYAPSTQFYLADKAAGRPWATRLPFPVHVVERIETVDRISGARFISRYRYGHGFFDGDEREFRGFAFVEREDTESFEDYVLGVRRIEGTQELDPALYQPPVTTRSWYHTGAGLEGPGLSRRLREEFYPATDRLPDPVLPEGLDARDWREACRALKGSLLRQEVYSFDGSERERHPYSVAENTYEVRRLQPRRGDKPAVFLTLSRESLSLSYERRTDDPRISHSFQLEVDPFGHPLKTASVVYGRRGADPSLPAVVTAEQKRQFITYSEADYTPTIDRDLPAPAYRMRVPFANRSYEITGVSPTGSLFTWEELKTRISGAAPIPYETLATGLVAQKRLLSETRTLYLGNGLHPLPLGQWDTLGLVHESYRLAFTPGIVAAFYAGRVTDAEFAARGYVHFDGDANWWIPSGTALYPSDPAAAFYIPSGAREPLGLERRVTYDTYRLLVERVRIHQAPWTEVIAVNDYRTLGPVLITDPNGNRSAVETDELGFVVKSAAMGKPGAGEGDTLADPTTRIEYDLFNWINQGKPSFARVLAREKHGPANTRWQESYVYSNGSGGTALVKSRVHPGKALEPHPDGTVVEVDADPRWAGTGRTIVNNKGNPVKQYEAYFSTTHEYEDEESLREIGSSPRHFYDPLGRHVLARYPDGTLSRIEFDSWSQRTFDPNDAVKESPWFADRGSPDPTAVPEPADPAERAAWLAAKHADTPGRAYLDSLGRPLYSIADYGGGVTAATRVEHDLTGRCSTLFDPAGRAIASGFVGLTEAIMGESAERGRRWVFHDVLGAMVKAWDDQGRAFRIERDELHRPVSHFVKDPGRPEILFVHVVYGDRHPDPKPNNLLGAAHLVFDQAGMTRAPALDFKGNPVRVERVLARDYRNALDWSALAALPDAAAVEAAAAPLLETGEVFEARGEVDALNRPTQVTLPDGTVIVPTYNEANMMTSLKARIRGQGGFVEFLKDQDYNAKGQRLFAHHGNDLLLRYFYDPKNFRLTRLVTYRSGSDPDTQAVQDLRYTYDPLGNITELSDEAQQTHYFQNAVVQSRSRFEYDALYQLVRATGREHAGTGNDAIRDHMDLAAVPSLPHPNDASAVRNYAEEYEYDRLGNLKVLKHRFAAAGGAGAGWTRFYRYAYQDDPSDRTNRLSTTSVTGDPEAGPYSAVYDYDGYGHMVRMPHLPDGLDWDFMGCLRHVNLGTGGHAYYAYDAGGGRVRKVIDRNDNTQWEWIFLGPVWLFRRRRRDTGALKLERWTVHIADNSGPIARADTKTADVDNTDPESALGVPQLRYRYGNHLGSSTVETDEAGTVLSYEEYHPFGTSSYRSNRPGYDLNSKQLRFNGKQLDEETGFYYFGARYYAPWLGRWTSADPAGFVDGLNLFRFCANSPVVLRDPNGTDSEFERFRSAPDRSIDIRLNADTGGEPTYSLTIEISDPATGDRLVYSEMGGVEGLRSLHSRLMSQSGVAAALTGAEREQLFNLLESFASSIASSAPVEGELPTIAVAPPPPERPRSRAPSRRSSAPRRSSPPPEPASPPPEEAPPPSTHPSTAGATASQTAPAAERFVWNHRFRNEGVTGAQRGRILERMAGTPWRSNTADYDIETATEVRQIKSTSSYDDVGGLTRSATRDAARAIADNPTGTMAGKRPRAVIITPTDAPRSVSTDIGTSLNPGPGRKIPANALPPEHVRGFPGRWGTGARVLTGVGAGFSAYSLYNDIEQGDVPMAFGDTLGLVGGGLELYALAVPGATVAGFSAMTVGLVIGGLGISVTSGISAYRSFQAGDTAGGVVGLVGVGAGLAIAAGAIGIAAGIAGAPVLLAVGVVAAIGVGVFHLGRYFDWW
jgi:RHS repeat-associated protein